MSYPDIPARLNITSLVIDRHLKEGRAEHIALHFGDRRFTYRELSQMVNAAGNALLGSGLVRGDRVLIRSSNCPEYLTTFLAALKIGCVPIPTNSLFRSWELEHILRNSGARVGIYDNGAHGTHPRDAGSRPTCRPLSPSTDAAGGGSEPFAAFIGGRVAGSSTPPIPAVPTSHFIIYTSGTTGEPKGVEHAHRWIAATGYPITQQLMRLSPDDICFSPLEISFIYALGCNFLYPFLSGAAIAMTPGRFDPERTLAAIDRLKPTVLIAVPTLFRRLLALGEALKSYDLSSLRMGMSSGEPLPDDTLRSAREWLGIEIYDCLGQTEMHIFMNPDPMKKLGSLGRPLEGHMVTILNDEGHEATGQRNWPPRDSSRRPWPVSRLSRPSGYLERDAEERVVLHQRSRPPRRRRLFLVRLALGRSDQEPGVSDLAQGSGVGADGASCSARGRRHRCAG